MPFSKIDTDNIKFSVVDEIIDKNGKEYYVEVKFSKAFFSRYSYEEKNDSVIDVLKNSLITNREIEVLKYIAKGKNNNQIAKYLNVSIHTAKVHVQNIFKKLSVDDRTAAVVAAIKLGLLNI